ncbi:MAG: BMC domain-containing protein [bacterium]|jgi:microcompartment protein CcmL/EutN|nr:BMC domain-containing protein [bacterium]
MQALGLIEVVGLAGAIEAADAAVKNAESVVSQIEYADKGYVTVKLLGGVADVQAAVEAGAAAASRITQLIAAHVIPRPHEEVDKLVHYKPEMTSAGMDVLMKNPPQAAPKKVAPKPPKK